MRGRSGSTWRCWRVRPGGCWNQARKKITTIPRAGRHRRPRHGRSGHGDARPGGYRLPMASASSAVRADGERGPHRSSHQGLTRPPATRSSRPHRRCPYTSLRPRWLWFARRRLHHQFPYLPGPASPPHRLAPRRYQAPSGPVTTRIRPCIRPFGGPASVAAARNCNETFTT